MKIVFRLLKIILLIFKHRAYFVFSYLKIPFVSSFQKELSKAQAKKVVKIFEDLGPVYIKLGQFLSSRSDILGKSLASELKQLQDKVTKEQKINIKNYLEEEFNIVFENHFKDISKTPIASASVACVYKATTIDNKTLAIKVLNKDLHKTIKKDLPLLKFILNLVLSKKNITKSRLQEVVKFVEKHFIFESDLRFEAACIEEFNELYKNTPNLVLPNIVWDFSSCNVLTTNFIEGYKVNELPESFNKRQIANNFVKIFILQMLENGIFHGDMHEGNILIDKNSNICLIDFGIVGRLDERSKYYLGRIFNGLLNKNYKDAAKAHIEAGYVSKEHNVDEFALACRAIASRLFEQKQEDISISLLLTQLFDITKMFEMKVQTQLILLQKNMILVEAFVKTLYPKGNLWIIAREHVANAFEAQSKTDKKLQASYIAGKEIITKIDKLNDNITNISNALLQNSQQNKLNKIVKLTLLTVFLIFLYHNFVK